MNNTERVAKLSERLKALQHTLKSDKAVKSGEFETRVQVIEEQFAEAHEQNRQKFETLKDNVRFFFFNKFYMWKKLSIKIADQIGRNAGGRGC